MAKYGIFNQKISLARGSNNSFGPELAKDPKNVPQSMNDKRVYMMLGTKEKVVTKVIPEFFNNVIPVFEKFILLFQKISAVVHILYDSLCDILKKLKRRFLTPQAIESKYGSDLAYVESKNVNFN